MKKNIIFFTIQLLGCVLLIIPIIYENNFVTSIGWIVGCILLQIAGAYYERNNLSN